MSLPSPDLDTRKFQRIVDDVKRQIGLRCPEWTDHNVTDPGVTLIELFASMTEMALYRLNQVPEKNYIKFLEMLGISLEMPEPARTDLRFFLTRAIDDSVAGEDKELTIKAGEVASTLRTETEYGVEFTTDADLRLVRPKLTHLLSVSAQNHEGDGDVKSPRAYAAGKDALPRSATPSIWGSIARSREI
jgi:predicted phage baseplate assembly protein